MGGMDYRKSSHTVYDLKYHVVWITKYRRAVLRGQIALRLRELLRQTCEANDIYIEKGHVANDHVHLLVSVPPQVSVSEMMQRLKGRSARKMLQEFNELRRQFWGQHLWARGYFVASSGNVTDEIIKQYIESQGQQPSVDDQDFQIGEL
jgi:REP-associated tyrosine transposase